MNEAFQRALRAEDLDAIRLCPKSDLHSHGWAGAEPASVAAILGTRCATLDHTLTSMDEMHAWVGEHFGNPDPKLRLIKRGAAEFELRAVHEDMKMQAPLGHVAGDMVHHAYPTLESFIEHANRYSSLGAEMVAAEHKVGFSFVNIVLRPMVRFFWAYFFRMGFLDGREGLLVLMNHAAYVSWKYAKAWEVSKNSGH